jgi:hypothetical protein
MTDGQLMFSQALLSIGKQPSSTSTLRAVRSDHFTQAERGNRLISFVRSIHSWLGARMATAELEVLPVAMFRRLPGRRVDDPDPMERYPRNARCTVRSRCTCLGEPGSTIAAPRSSSPQWRSD